MKNLMNFYALMWLFLIGVLFSISSCKRPLEGEPNIGPSVEKLYFALVDSNAYNICKTKENSPYNVDEIYIIMHDGTRVPDLSYYTPERGQNYSSHPANRGLVFVLKFLHDQATSNGSEYADKPFYLVLSEEDTDTLMWKLDENRLYHNGKKAPIDDGSYGGSPFMLVKETF